MKKVLLAVCAAAVVFAGGLAFGAGVPDPATGNHIVIEDGDNITVETDAMGGFSNTGDEVYDNSVTVDGGTVGAPGAEVPVRGGGSWGGSASEVNQNDVIINGGTIYGKVVGGDSWSTSGTPSASVNTVTINNGTIVGNVFGAQSGGTTDFNEVIIKAGNAKAIDLTGEVTGGTSNSGAVTSNTVAISTEGTGTITNITNVFGGALGAGGATASGVVSKNDASITGQSGAAISIGGSVYGGSSVGTGAVSENTAYLKYTTLTGDVFGGTINNAASTAAVSGNSATLAGGVTAVNVFGGSTNGAGDATGNKVFLDNTGGSVTTVFGGQNTGTGNASKNSVTMTDGAVTSAIYGGWVKGSGKAATENAVTISGGTFTGASGLVVGGFVDASAVNGSATGNTVSISGGTFIAGSSIIGGQARGTGTASGNAVGISSGTVNSTVYGGMAETGGSATGNNVSISGGTVNAAVYGGTAAGTGSATNNVVNISGGTFAAGTQIVGGQAVASGVATGNTVKITGNVQFANGVTLYGGMVNGAAAAAADNAISISNGAAVSFSAGVTNFDMLGGNVSLDNASFNSANVANLTITGSLGIGNSGHFTLASGTNATLGGPITVASGGQLTLGANLSGVSADIALNGGSLITSGGTSININGNDLTAKNNSVISIGSDGTNLADITSSGTITLDGSVKLAIDSNITTLAPDTLLVTGATLNAAAWYEANKNGVGTAIQSYKFKLSADGKSIAVENYGLITSYNETSRRNSAKNMASLGVHNADQLVDSTFGRALFNVAQGVDNGNPVDPIDPTKRIPGIAPTVFADQSSQAYKNASTTWSILRAFGNMGGGHVFASATEANSAASAMTGQNQAATVSSMISIAGDNVYSINNRVAANNLARAKANEFFGGSGDALAAAALNANPLNRLWVGGLGMWENAGSRDASNGYKLDTWGFMTGYDRIFGPLTVGASFGYSQGDFEEKDVLNNKAEIRNYAFNLYGAYNHSSGLFATLMGGYAYSPVELRRSVTNAASLAADYKVNTWTIGGNIGYDWRPLERLTVTPRLGLYHYSVRSGTIDDAFVSISDLKDHVTQMPIDLTAVYAVPLSEDRFLDMTLRGGFAYNFNESGAEGVLGYNNLVGVSPISVKGRSAGRETWNIGTGVKYRTAEFDVGLRYDYYAKSSYHAHRLTGELGMNF